MFRTEYLLEKYGGAVPRYTSYPTAPYFKPDFPSSYLSDLLSSLKAEEAVSIYIHIPFCRQLCHYCGCFTKVINDDGPLKGYVNLLIREIEMIGEIAKHRPLVSHIHFGGGTPNTLSAQDLKDILDTVRKYFTVIDGAEIAMEVDPRLMHEEKAKSYAALGVNRASLGVQDFQEDVQRAINRVQPYGMIERTVNWLRKAGIKSINFDLIYGLPLQTEVGIEDSIEKAVSLHPDRIALFGYAHVPWMKRHQQLLEEYHIPDMKERFTQQGLARQKIIDSGYDAIGMDHFALPGDIMSLLKQDRKLKRNFQGYTTDNAETVIGFGLSSIGSFPQAYIQNTSDITEYRNKLKNGELPIVKGMVLSDEDMMRREIIQTLMCEFVVDVQAICNKYGLCPSVLLTDFDGLDGLFADGLVTIDDYKVTVTEEGRPFVRVVCACFDAYLAKFSQEEPVKRHAQAV